VWDARGSIDLVPHPTPHRLLAALLARGEADKESLVVSVWGERDYHPLRHDNRLQATMHKLRRLLGDEGAVARRVRTTEGGYALVGRVRIGELA
jgi:DNA-binding winged helix-turn-helix (wHTH) protein